MRPVHAEPWAEASGRRHHPVLGLLLLGLAALAGCDDGGPAGPGLSDSLMVEALVELHLADARAAQTGEDRDSLRTAALATHGLDTTAFRRALDYFAAHPDAYHPLYDRALDQLLREQRQR